MALIHKYTLVCDEVRREDNGKFLIMGLYTPGIVLQRFPFTLPKLTFLNFFDVTTPGVWKLACKFSHILTGAIAGPEGSARIEVPHVNEKAPALVPIVFPGLTLQMPGDYALTLTGEDFEAVNVIVPITQRVLTKVH